ncbi:MAG: bifunctional phosphopantothenoylcysteine decarboxylase/phosphopantothenate--cysteine ligase CoaBC [Reyranellaceae bacterium]
MLQDKRILLIVGGGIAAFKALELIRRLRERGARVRCVLTAAGAQFVTPLSLQSLSEDKVYDDMFSLTDESEMGHIQLSRQADLLVVVPATANLMARMAAGIADDLAATVLLATDKKVLIAPAMNVRMWTHPATQANLATLKARGVEVLGPVEGAMACNEHGPGRMVEPNDIVAAIETLLSPQEKPLQGRRAVVTSGPTREAIDPVRYISNQSSGKQGHAIAAALARLGAETVLVSGPVALADPPGVKVVRIDTAQQMLAATLASLPADIAVCAAAVADWRVAQQANAKIKKSLYGPPPRFELVPNPDILATIAKGEAPRPALVVGFAAETEAMLDNAQAKRRRKGCDWIVANDVSPSVGTFGSDSNTVHLLSDAGIESWPTMSKAEVAARLAQRIAQHFAAPPAKAAE